MSATEDESQSLDGGWDDEQSPPSSPDEADVDEAWDSLPPPVSRLSGGVVAPSMPPVTEEVDSGWDDVPEGAPGPEGKRRRHRQRRPKAGPNAVVSNAVVSNAVVASASPVLLPRPAEPSKKQQRDHARKQRAHEAQVKQQRKVERKAQRAAEMREDAAARLRQAEAEESARQARRAARERAEPKPRKVVAPKPSRAAVKKRSEPSLAVSKSDEADAADESIERALPPSKSKRPGLVVAILVLAVAAVAFFLLQRR